MSSNWNRITSCAVLPLLTAVPVAVSAEDAFPVPASVSGVSWPIWILLTVVVLLGFFLWRQRVRIRTLTAAEDAARVEFDALLGYVDGAAEHVLLDFFHCDETGRDLSRGKHCRRHWRYREDGMPVHPKEWVYPPDLEPFLARWQQLLRGEISSLKMTYRHEEDGRIAHYEMCALRRCNARTGRCFIYGLIRDVSTREGVRVQLSDTQALLETVIDNLPMHLYIKDADLNFRYVMCSKHTLSRKPEEVIGQTDFSILDPDLARRSYESDLQLLKDGGERTWVGRFRIEDRGERVVSVYKKLLVQTNGHRLILTVLADITEDALRREEMEKTNAILTGILHHLPVWITVKNTDDDFRYLIWNRAAERLSGIPAAQAVGSNDAELPGLAASAGLSRRQDELALEQGILHGDDEIRNPAGNVVSLQTIRMRLHHAGHENLELMMGIDTTDERRLEQAQQEKLLLIDAVRIPILLFDAEHRLLRVNRAAQEISGLTETQIYGRRCCRSFCGFGMPPEQCPVRLVLQDRETHHWEAALGGRDYHLTAYPIIQNGELKYVLKTLIDISDSNESRQRLAAALKAAEKANLAKSHFLATVSHEIRTPLNAVIGFSELLRDGGLPEAEQKDYLDAIHMAGNTLLGLINDVLELSKIESEQVEIVPQPTDIGKLLEDIVGIFRHEAESKGIRIAVSPGTRIPVVRIDTLRLRQILLNIVGNAVKFTHQGGVILRSSWSADSGTLSLEVADSGVGIREEEQLKIFEPFHQQDVMRDTHIYKGSGLGLAIARKLTHKMGGSISVASREGLGSTFAVRFSRIAAEE